MFWLFKNTLYTGFKFSKKYCKGVVFAFTVSSCISAKNTWKLNQYKITKDKKVLINTCINCLNFLSFEKCTQFKFSKKFVILLIVQILVYTVHCSSYIFSLYTSIWQITRYVYVLKSTLQSGCTQCENGPLIIQTYLRGYSV